MSPEPFPGVPAPVEADSRGILHPARFRRRVRLTRFPPPPDLEGLLDRFWAVEWDLSPGEVHRQEVLAHPCANLSIGSLDGATLSGVSTRLAVRTLSGRGWNVAAMTTPGGLGAFLPGPVGAFNDRTLPLGEHLDVPADLVGPQAGDVPALVGRLGEALAGAVRRDRRPTAVEVARVAGHAERDRSLRRATDLAAVAGYGVRTLQRLFREYVGVSPGWVLRRYRLIDAAEAVRDGVAVNWAELAGELGYADQAHLVRDFRATLGATPAAYGQAQRAGQPRMSARS